MGFQNRGDTLLAWSDRLIRILSSRFGSKDVVPPDLVYRSAIDLHGESPSSIELRIPADEARQRPRAQHWLLTEAYWAASFQPPSVSTMLAWLGARGAAALAARGFPAGKLLRNTVYLTGLVIGVLVVYAAIRVVTSIIPVTAVRNALVAPLDRLLTGWSGDMHVLLFDPAQSANVRTRIREAMEDLAAAGFSRIAVVAHSGGAVATYLTLTDPVPWTANPRSGSKVPKVHCYITHGQGLNIAWRLCDLGEDADCDDASGSCRRLATDVHVRHRKLRWHDFYSEGDTVSGSKVTPPACIPNAGPAPDDEHEIENKPSNPHGTYWDNDEEFLLPVVQRLELAARTDVDAAQPTPGLPPPHGEWRDRRLLRVGMFSLTSRVLFSAMVAAIVASVLFGGARLDDLGRWVVSIAADIPGNEILTGPIGWLRDASAVSPAWARWIGTLVVTILLLLAAVYPVVRLLPTKLAWNWRPLGPLIAAIDIGAAILPLVPVVAWAIRSMGGPSDTYAPVPQMAIGLVLVAAFLGGAYLLFSRQDPERPALAGWKRPERGSGLSAAGLLLVVGILTFGTAVAIFGDEDYGATTLGVAAIGVVVLRVLFTLLGRIANWRWDAWDEQEREQFRQAKGEAAPSAVQPRPWGRRVDLLVIGLVGVAAIALAMAVGAPFGGPGLVGQASFVVVLLVVVIGLVGSGQDAANSRAGVSPQQMTPLPSSAA